MSKPKDQGNCATKQKTSNNIYIYTRKEANKYKEMRRKKNNNNKNKSRKQEKKAKG